MSVITLIASFLFGLLVGGMSADKECVYKNSQTNVPYHLQASQSPISNQVPNRARLYPPYKKCNLIPYDYAYNPTVDCLSSTSNRVIDPVIPLFLSPSLVKAVTLLEVFIQDHYNSSINIADTIAKLHLSLDYFSCYTAQEQTGIETGLSKYQWSSFNITFYHNINCNIDIRQGYIELYVDAQSQLTLQTFVKGLEQSVGNVSVL